MGLRRNERRVLCSTKVRHSATAAMLAEPLAEETVLLQLELVARMLEANSNAVARRLGQLKGR